MLVWTVQPISVWKQIEETGEYHCIPERSELLKEANFKKAYNWLVKEMRKSVGEPPKGVIYPVWAWYLTEGKNKRIDMRKITFRVTEPSVMLEVELDEKDVFLTDHCTWHCVLNDAINYKANYDLDISDEDWFEKAEEEDRFFYNLSKKQRKQYLEDSWKKVIYRIGDEFIPDYVQATFWKLKKENVRNSWFLKGYKRSM